MRATSKHVLGVAAASALVLGAAGAAFGYGGYGPGYGPGWGMHRGMTGGPARVTGGDPVAFAEQRLDRLEAALGITSEQREAWDAYADAVKGRAELMADHRRARLDAAGPLDREQRLSLREEGLEQMRKVTAAARDLNRVLTAGQQAQAGDLVGPSFGPRCLR